MWTRRTLLFPIIFGVILFATGGIHTIFVMPLMTASAATIEKTIEKTEGETDPDDEDTAAVQSARQRAVEAAKRLVTAQNGTTAKNSDSKKSSESGKSGAAPLVREDVVSVESRPGCLTLSDGSTLVGTVFLTRDRRVKIEDKAAERQREIPLSAIAAIETIVDREWMEEEWRFRENANNEKYFTGRSYPARLYSHRVTLTDGRMIEGALSEVVYIDPSPGMLFPGISASEIAARGVVIPTQRFLLNKRDKGELGRTLKELNYVQTIRLGDAAFDEGLKKAKKSPLVEKIRSVIEAAGKKKNGMGDAR